MGRVVYVNGDYLPEAEAKISVFDRGFLFADGVHEVTSVLEGRLIDYPGHLTRLYRSLGELEMPAPVGDDELGAIHREMIARNALTEGLVYVQVTRGAADRDFAYPAEPQPSLVLFTQARTLADNPAALDGIRVIAVPDIRWARRDIKTVQLLAPSTCKMLAKKAGCDDAWLVEDGFVTEGTSNYAWIVTGEGTIVTRDLSQAILHGVTRAAAIACRDVTPVVEIGGVRLGDGAPGSVTRRLRALHSREPEAGGLG